MRLWTLLIVMLSLGCGDPTDSPEDCSPNEFFDEARNLCFTCPATLQPPCDDGCGFAIVADDRGCPSAECLLGDACQCSADEFLVDATLQCAACTGPVTCPVGEPVRWVADGACTLRCP